MDMTMLLRFIHEMMDEVSGAKDYAKLAVELKAAHPAVAQTYYKLAQEEMVHATTIRNEAAKLEDKMASDPATGAMVTEMWNTEHAFFMDHYASVKAILDMYAK